MESAKSPVSVTTDVLHFEDHSKLSAEEIAKALAHHNRRHGGESPQSTPAKTGSGKKNK